MKKIPLFYPFIPKEDIMREIEETLSGRWLGQGPKVKKFESMWNEKFGYDYSLMVNSGTAALELTYHLLDIKEGDDVIVPILDCTAGQMGLLRRKANIVFTDVDDNLNMCPIDLEKKITKNTKAIIAVHLGGIEFSSKINDIAKKYNIPLIVDAAQHHAKCNGDYICYSFQAIKHITTADGGMLVLNNDETYKRAKLLRWFGIDRDLKEQKNYQAWERREMTFDIIEPGYKFQPTDIDGCFGIASLPHLDNVIKYRQILVERYRSLLPKECHVIAGGSCWLIGILVDRRDELAEYLTKYSIDNNLIHLRNDIFSVFGGKRLDLPNMNKMESKYLYLPLNTEVSIDDVEFICEKINTFYGI